MPCDLATLFNGVDGGSDIFGGNVDTRNQRASSWMVNVLDKVDVLFSLGIYPRYVGSYRCELAGNPLTVSF
jgi:hypothetical protein